MKKVFIITMALCVSIFGNLFSASLDFDDLINKLQKTYVEPFAKDIGSVLAGGMSHSGRTLGLVPGVDVGVGASLSTKPSSDNVILKNSIGEKLFGMPFIQLSKGLPMNIDIVLRGFPETQGIQVLGFGLKYGIIQKELAAVSLGLSAMYSYNSLTYDTFKANVNSLSGMISLKIPMIEPYIGISIDSTKLETDFTIAQLPAGVQNLSVTTTQPKYVAGINLSLIPLTYINIGATYLIDHIGADIGIGIKF
ncbi:MAG TPA: hypothetical protein DCP53_08240 [Elusimicrobia bacterium]|nr:hypothetical protein [Elusimicrobiota bacterium]